MASLRSTFRPRLLAGGFTAALLAAAVAGAAPALADDVPVGDAGVPLTLAVEATGELSMAVDTLTPVALAENGSTDDHRRFTGTLPTVTVTDTRSDIPEQVYWNVVGQSSDFVHADDSAVTIPGEYLGWVPALVAVPDDDDTVFPGWDVESTATGGLGLAGGADLLFLTWDSQQAQEFGTEWKANAELELIAPVDDVASGDYTATLTLSLFENEWE